MKSKRESLEKKESSPKGRVPKLRFPEFQASEGWDKKGLGELFSERQETGYSDLPLLSLTDKDGIILQSDGNRKNTSNSDKSKYLRVVPGDIAYNTMRMWEGRSAIVDREGIVSPAYTVCKPEEIANSIFFSYYFKTSQLIKFFRQYSQGLVKDTLNLKYENFTRISVYTPPIPEQQKIADCLSSLDELIAAHNRKLDALKAHKKGLVQRLFPAEGETVPKLRFPEFRDAPEWETKRLGEIAHFYKGKNISKADIDPQGKTQCIRYGELYTHYNEVIKTIFSKTNLPISELFFSCMNDVIIPASGETKLDIATASCVPFDGVALGGDINVIRCNQNGVFLSYYLNSAKKIKIAKIAQGDTVVHLYSSQLKELDVMLPKSPEQQKIADCLSSLDELIAVQTQKLDILKSHKKGLLQQLFPSTDEEVTR